MAESKLVVKLVAENAKLHRDLDRSNKKLKRFSSNAKKHAGLVTKALAGIGVAIVIRQFTQLAKSALDAGDALAKTSAKLGIATEKLAGLHRAAKITGVSQEAINKALTKQQKAIFDANRGLLTYKQHFDALNLSTKDLMKLSPDKQFGVIAEALNKVENQTLKTAIAYDIFGGRGTALINTLAVGKEGLEAFNDQAVFLDTAMSKETAKKMEDVNDAITTMGDALMGATNIIVANFGPQITNLINTLAYGLPVAVLETSVALKELELTYAKTAAATQKLHLTMFELTTIPFGKAYEEELRIRQESLNHARTEVDFIENRELPALEKQLEAKNRLKGSFEFDATSGAAEINPAESVLGTKDQFQSTIDWQQNVTTAHIQMLNKIYAQGSKDRIKTLSASEKFTKGSYKSQTKTVLGEVLSMTNGVATSNKTMFRINKIAGIANATIGAYEGAAKTMGAYPYPLNIALAGLSLAAGLAQVQAIKSQSFGGGGGGGTTPSVAGSVSTISDVPFQPAANIESIGQEQAQEKRLVVQLSIDDDEIYSGKAIRTLMEKIGEQIGDGVTFA